MGRPLKKSNFGANTKNNIKVQFHNGTTSTVGYIVEQRSSVKFLCSDSSGTTVLCKLVDKASGALSAGEMTITLKGDDGQINQAVKISKNLATVAYSGTNYVTGGTHGGTVSYGQVRWSYSTSTSDTYWQIEEAGTNTNLTTVSGAVDLEGDDGPVLPFGMDRNAPLPGSGDPLFTTATSGIVAYTLKGTAYNPGSGVASVTNSTAGLYRRKYVGLALTAAGNTSTWNMNFFSTSTSISTADKEVDTFVSFGQRDDLPYEDGYSFEWKGYVYADTTATYNTAITCDDDVVMWVGSAALAPSKTNAHHAEDYNNQGNVGYNPNSLSLTGGLYYPVRIWFTEYGGSERFQLFMNRSSGSPGILGGTGTNAITFAHNSVTTGYNP
jgi:hypothetical protein